MSEKPPSQKAKAKRDSASRARRLASTGTQDADKDRLLEFAEEQETEANELERQVEELPPPGVGRTSARQQQPTQPQQATDIPSDAKPKSRRP
jgi:hypothetical protein